MLYEMNDVSEMPSSAAAAAAAARGRTTLSPTHDVTADTDSSHSDSGKGPSEEGDSQQLHDVSHDLSHDSQMAPQTFAMSIFNAKHNDNSRAHARINKPSILKKSPLKPRSAAVPVNNTQPQVHGYSGSGDGGADTNPQYSAKNRKKFKTK